MISPGYILRPCSIEPIRALCEQHHGYGSAGVNATYAFGVYENERIVAGYVWQPPPPGSARGVCPDVPSGVLSLSRMVAVPREERTLNHVSKPLRRQMRVLIDRTRWPVLVTYSDEGQGHTGHVYKCSGWQPTVRSKRPVFVTSDGVRASSYSNGSYGSRDLHRTGFTYVQRWEHWICNPEDVLDFMRDAGWRHVPIPGKVWRSGRQAHTWIRGTP